MSDRQSEFRERAAHLSACLHDYLDSMRGYRGDRTIKAIAESGSADVAPIVAAYDRAVFIDRSRSAAADCLSEFEDARRRVNTAIDRDSCFAFGTDRFMSAYFDLSTLFREVDFRDECL